MVLTPTPHEVESAWHAARLAHEKAESAWAAYDRALAWARLAEDAAHTAANFAHRLEALATQETR